MSNLPFSIEEYETRRTRLRDAMAERGIDLLYVTQPANLLYLTGYEAIWYPPRLPVGALIDRHSQDVVILDWDRHAGYVKSCVLGSDFILFKYGESSELIRRYLATRGWLNRTLALEWSSPNPTAPVMRELAESLAAAGVRIVSGDWIVDNLRLYKSRAEVACVRQAAAIADRAMQKLWGELRPGLTELAVSTRLTQLLSEEGSELAATPTLVNSGPDAWRDVHSFPSRRVLQAGDVVTVDCCGVIQRYHANLGRTFVLGPSSTRARDIIQNGAGSFDVLRSLAQLDADPAGAMAAADRYVRDRVPAENIWWIGGYNLGIALPPSWVGHTYLANDGLQKCRLAAGYVANFENVYADREEGFEGGCIDTLLMTRDGLELLSTLPRKLLDVPA
jgi:hypothetical protein